MEYANLPILRTSERRSFKHCQSLWWWAWHEALIKKGTPRTALWFGTGVHLALALWYCGPGLKRGPHPVETWKEYCKQEIQTIKISGFDDDGEESIFVDAVQLGIAMLENYVNTYGKDEHMFVIQAEQKFDIKVPWPDWALKLMKKATGDVLTRYDGTYDLAYRNLINNQIWLEEHKTAAQIRVEHLTLDDQGGSYWAVAGRSLRKMGLIGPKEKLRGIEYNFLRKGLPDDRPKDANGIAHNKPIKKHFVAAFENSLGRSVDWNPKMKLNELQMIADQAGIVVLGEQSKRQPQPLLLREPVHRTSAERKAQLQRIQTEAVQIHLIREGIIPKTKTPRIDCSYACDYFDLCELEDRGGDTEEFKKMVFGKWEPYADHRKSTED